MYLALSAGVGFGAGACVNYYGNVGIKYFAPKSYSSEYGKYEFVEENITSPTVRGGSALAGLAAAGGVLIFGTVRELLRKENERR